MVASDMAYLFDEEVPMPMMDPYEELNFRVKWDGKYVAGVSKVSALKRTVEVVEYRDGGEPDTSRKLPGRTVYDAITLERGVTNDTTFEQWANEVGGVANGTVTGASPNGFRKDVVIDLYNGAGQLVKSYKVYQCWPSEYGALPSLDSNGNAIAIENIKLENEGWERDTSVVAPA
jgi:phage tail-like protein